MTDPNIVNVVDADGVESWAARDSKYIQDGLREGTFVEKGSKSLPKKRTATGGEGVDNAASDATDGDGKNSGKPRS